MTVKRSPLPPSVVDDATHATQLALLNACVDAVSQIDIWQTLTMSGDTMILEHRFKVQYDDAYSIRRVLQKFDLTKYNVSASRFGDTGIVLVVYPKDARPMTDFVKGR